MHKPYSNFGTKRILKDLIHKLSQNSSIKTRMRSLQSPQSSEKASKPTSNSHSSPRKSQKSSPISKHSLKSSEVKNYRDLKARIFQRIQDSTRKSPDFSGSAQKTPEKGRNFFKKSKRAMESYQKRPFGDAENFKSLFQRSFDARYLKNPESRKKFTSLAKKSVRSS